MAHSPILPPSQVPGAAALVFDGEVRQELDGWRDAVQQRLGELLPAAAEGAGDPVSTAMREATLASGKRIRPLLLLAAARCLGRDPLRLLDAACALEMVHAASLILDDLPCMDDALERRGRPALHRTFGEAVALLASVALLSRACGVLAVARDCDAALRTRLVSLLANAVGPAGLVRGQWRDLRGAAGTRREGVQAAEETNQLKTGSLFVAAFEMAAAEADADEAAQACLRECARAAGQAFQLKDDLDDAIGAVAVASPVGQGSKPTLVSLLGQEQAQQRLASHLAHAQRLLDEAFGERSAGLRCLIARIAA